MIELAPVHAAARLGKHRAPRAVAGYKRSSVALVSTALPPGLGSATGTSKGHAKSIRWVLYGGEAYREAKSKNALCASSASP